MSVEFLTQAAQIDGVSISAEDECFVATCEELTDTKIDTEKVHATAAKAGLQVVNSVADLEARHIRVFVAREEGDGV